MNRSPFLTMTLTLLACGFAPPTTTATPSIEGEAQYRPFKLIKLMAKDADPKAGLLWRVYPSQGVDRATTPRGLLQFTAPPGRYEVELLVITSQDGAIQVEEARRTIEIEAPPDNQKPLPPTPPTPPTPPSGGGKLDPVNALAQVRFNLGGGRYGSCTTTVIYPQRPDGRWDLLCAAHCMKPGQRGEVRMKDGLTFTATTRAHDTRCDLAWLVTDEPIKDLPYAMLATSNPPTGEAVWHMGYGVDKPSNREEGVVTAGEDSNGQLRFILSVSSGDSGGGIFNSRNEVVSAVCCTSIRGAKTDMWGGSCQQAWKLRPKDSQPIAPIGSHQDAEWPPVEIPRRARSVSE